MWEPLSAWYTDPPVAHNGMFIVRRVGLNTLRPRQNGRHFADDMFRCIFLNENVMILAKISLKFVRKGPINNIPALVQIMAWRRPGDKPLSEPMVVRLPTHICVTRPQWVKLRDRNKILRGGDLSHLHVPDCIWVFFYLVWFVFIHHNFQFYFELCTYCNILDIYLS